MNIKTYLEPVFVIDNEEYKVGDRIKCSGDFIADDCEGNIRYINDNNFKLKLDDNDELKVFYDLLTSIEKVEDTIEVRSVIKIKLGEFIRIYTKNNCDYVGEVTKITNKIIELTNQCDEDYRFYKKEIINIEKISIEEFMNCQ